MTDNEARLEELNIMLALKGEQTLTPLSDAQWRNVNFLLEARKRHLRR
jgi:hypothetical protein